MFVSNIVDMTTVTTLSVGDGKFSPLQPGHTAALLQHLADTGHLLLGEAEGGDGGVGGWRGGEGAGRAGDLAPSQS